MKQLPEENIDTYTKRYQKIVQNAERVITKEEKVMKYQEGLLPMYYANTTIGNSANLTEAIRNAKNCKKRNQSKYNTKNNKRHLNYIGIHSSERSRILDEESSSDEDNEKRFYPILTRSQKYGNASTNIRRNKTDNFQQ